MIKKSDLTTYSKVLVQNEIRIMRKVSHAKIVEVVEILEDPVFYCIVMEIL